MPSLQDVDQASKAKAPSESSRRFQIAVDRARAEWARADPALSAAMAGCAYSSQGVEIRFFGISHLVTHPAGEVLVTGFAPPAAKTAHAETTSKIAHPSIVILLLHYLLTADGTRPADRWIAFRELPDGLFYAQAFSGHAEGAIAARFSADLHGFGQAAGRLGGTPLDLADVSFRFLALPRLALAVLLWAGDEEFPGQARILYDAAAGHYLPTEDLSGIGDWLSHRLVKG